MWNDFLPDDLQDKPEVKEPSWAKFLPQEPMPEPGYSFEPSEASEPYLKMIGEAESKYNLPKHLLSNIIQTESQFRPEAVSEMGATGIAQIMPGYHPDVDPTDPIASIDYAGGYLRKLYDQFGDWDKAIAAYNTGPGNLRKYGMEGLPEETRNYLDKIKSAKVSGLKQTIEPPKIEQPPMATEAPGDAERFYDSTIISPPVQGLIPMVWTPEIASYMGKQGFGPVPEGGWDEMLRPLDDKGDPYTLDIPEDPAFKSVKTTLKDAAVRTGMELVAASELALSLASGMMLYFPSKLYGLMALPFGAEVAKIAEEEMGSLGYQPFTDKGRAATELIGKGFELFLWPAHKAGEITAKDFPRLGYITEFGYELMEFAIAGGLVKGFKSKLKPEQKKRVIEAKRELDNAELVKRADAVESIPDVSIKEAQRKVIEVEKVQADLAYTEAIKKVGEDAMIVEEMGKQVSEIVKAKAKTEEGLIKLGKDIKVEIEALDVSAKERARIREEYRETGVEPIEVKGVKAKPPELKLPEFPEAKIKPEEFKEPESVTEVDLSIGTELPKLKGESSPFFQSKEKTESLRNLYEERAKSVASDPELLTQKLINDVNRWYQGEDIPIDKVRNSLTELSTRSDEIRMEFITGQDHFLWKETVSEAADWARGLDRLKIEPSVELYTGIPWKEILKKLKITKEGYPKIDTSKLSSDQRKTYNLGKEWDDAFEAAREAKKFKLKRFIDRSGLHTGRAIHERKHRLRRQLKKQYGAEGDKILQYIDANDASGGKADRMLFEMEKEAFRDVPSKLTTQVSAVNLASRLTDIYSYKTPAQFKPPKGMGPEQTAVFETLMSVYKKMTPEERKLAEKASNVMFEHVKMAVDELVRVGLKSKEEGEALKSHNYRKIRSLNVEKMYDQKYKQGIRIGDKMVRQTDSGVDSLGQNPITMLETDWKVLYGETMSRIYRRVENQEMKLKWKSFDAKYEDNPFVIFKDNDVKLKRSDRKIPSGYVKDYWYEEGKMKTMYYHPDVALQVLASGPHMSYPLTRVLTTVLGINLTRALTVGTSAFWATTRGLTMDLGHTFFSARSFNPETGKYKRTYSKTPPVYLGQIGRDMYNTFYDVMTRGEKTGVYEKSGGSMPFLAMREQHFGKKGIKAPGAYDKIMDGLSFWSQGMERWNRVAVMERVLRQEAKKKGITLEKAYKNKDMAMSATNTAVERLPYRQGGWLVKEMDKIFGPFISASYNAARTFLRGAKENPVDFAARISTIAIPTVGATIAMTLFAPEAKRDTPEWQHIGGPVVTLFPDSLNFIDEEGNKRWINVRLPTDPMIAAFYNVFRGLTNKMLYEAGMTDVEPNYEAIIDSITKALPTGSSLAPVTAAFFTYFRNIDVWRDNKVVEEAFPWPMSEEEGQLDPKLGQLPKDIAKVTKLSAPRLDAAARQVGLQNNEYAWAIGKLYDMANNDLDPRLRMQHWAITLSQTPGMKNLMSVTVPRAYAKAGRKDLRQQDSFDKMLRRKEMNFLAEGYYWKGVGSESKIDKFIDKYEEEHIRKSLETRRSFIEKVKSLPHRSFWVSFFHVPPEMKAKEFYKLWLVESSPEERVALERELDDLLEDPLDPLSVGYVSKANEDRFFETLENLKYR